MLMHRLQTRGTSFVVVGPSGAGKDSVLQAALLLLPEEQRPHKVQRLITRPPHPDTENYKSVSPEHLEAARQRGELAISWQANGLGYGIEKTVFERLDAGQNVVMNGSRAALNAFRLMFQPLVVVHITADQATLALRLKARERESEKDILNRLERGNSYPVTGADVVEIDNTGPLGFAAAKLAEVLGG